MEKSAVARAASDTPLSVSVASALMFLSGIVGLGSLLLTVAAGRQVSADYPLSLALAIWLAYGAGCIATAIWLSRLERPAIPGVIALSVLSFGDLLADVMRREPETGTWVHVAVSLLALYAVARHRHLFARRSAG